MKLCRKSAKSLADTLVSELKGCSEKSVLFCLIKKQPWFHLYQDSVNSASVILSGSQLG